MATKKTVEKATKKAVKKTTKKAVKKAVKKLTKKAAKKATRKTKDDSEPERVARISGDRILDGIAKEPKRSRIELFFETLLRNLRGA